MAFVDFWPLVFWTMVSFLYKYFSMFLFASGSIVWNLAFSTTGCCPLADETFDFEAFLYNFLLLSNLLFDDDVLYLLTEFKFFFDDCFSFKYFYVLLDEPEMFYFYLIKLLNLLTTSISFFWLLLLLSRFSFLEWSIVCRFFCEAFDCVWRVFDVLLFLLNFLWD